ncbi:hypothetical protein ACFQBS_27210 [Planomonospora parontospora]|uniref:hypothetical protein n=1 Tax=Planomonospora parontospora TaxID=58119 RepID=UPI0036169545
MTTWRSASISDTIAAGTRRHRTASRVTRSSTGTSSASSRPVACSARSRRAS